MRPYSKREVRGLFLLVIVCLACISVGVLSRKDFFISRAVEKPTSRDKIDDKDSLSPTVGMNNDRSHLQGSKPDTESMKGGKRKKRTKGKSTRKHTQGLSPVYPVRDILNDTIHQKTL
ncbi:MAG: hypothetical protein K2H86_03375 [Muribaculaceae bacterium]|nr:hypothetical protein [Muribaculaceae bacterium]